MTQRKTFITLLFIFGWIVSFAQPYPVSTNISLTSPTVPFLDEFTVATSNPMIATIILNDINEVSYDVKLRLTISGEGITIRTRPDYLPLPITLTYNTPVIKTGTELAPYFNPDNLEFQGITKQQYIAQGRLPEGFYSVCIEAFDYQRDDVLAVSNRACATAQMVVHDPPVITTLKGQNYETTPQNYVFSWQPMHVGAFPVEYELSLYEAIPNLAPNQIFESTTPHAKVKTFSTTYLYTVFDPILQPDKEYYAIVRASDISNLNVFKNNGFSQYETFILETPCVPFSPCDDEDECTYNDIYTIDCECIGTPLYDQNKSVAGPFDIPQPTISYPTDGTLCLTEGNTIVAWTPGHNYPHDIDYELTLTRTGIDPYSSKEYLELKKEIEKGYNALLEVHQKNRTDFINKQLQKKHSYLITQGELTSICPSEYKDMDENCQKALEKAIQDFDKKQVKSYNLFLQKQQKNLSNFEKEKEKEILTYKEETAKKLEALIRELSTGENAPSVVFQKTINGLSYVITNEDIKLEAGMEYTVDITASDNCNQSTFSNHTKDQVNRCFIINCDAPTFEDTPVALVPVTFGKNHFTAFWKRMKGINHFLLKVASDPEFKNLVPQAAGVVVEGNTFPVNDLTPGTYYFNVTPIKDGVLSPVTSNVISISIGEIDWDCEVKSSCDDGDPCTINDIIRINCSCKGTYSGDSDNDGVCDAEDKCPNFDDNIDFDDDGFPDQCDNCNVGMPCDDGLASTENDVIVWDSTYPEGVPLPVGVEPCGCQGTTIDCRRDVDSDNDGVCDELDICQGHDDAIDTDGDSIPDGCDNCPGEDDNIDINNDGKPDCLVDPNCNANLTLTATPVKKHKTEVCNYCVVIDFLKEEEVTNLLQSVVVLVDNQKLVLEQGTPDFNFPYCLGESTEPYCDGYPYDMDKFMTDFNAWLYALGYSGSSTYDKEGNEICSSKSPTWVLVGSQMPVLSMNFSKVGYRKIRTVEIKPTRCDGLITYTYEITPSVSINSDSIGCEITETVWSTGETSSTIFVTPPLDDISVVVTCDQGCVYDSESVDCMVGLPCSDNDPCTTNDTFNEFCYCVGTYVGDSDNDGICNTLDICEGFNDYDDENGNGIPNGCDDCREGESCDDGDPCTVHDQYDENCNCIGTFLDSDNDYICDKEDQCPGFPDQYDFNNNGIPDGCETDDSCVDSAIASTPKEIAYYTIVNLCKCDKVRVIPLDSLGYVFLDTLGLDLELTDGEDTTSGEFFLGMETFYSDPNIDYDLLALDSDNDGVSDLFDMCPGSDDRIDVNENCIPDGCDVEEGGIMQDYTFVLGYLFDRDCDDGDECTTNDAVACDCECTGLYADSDGDTVCDELDICEGDDLADFDSDGIPDSCDFEIVCPEIANQTPCDDNDPCTFGDDWEFNYETGQCECAGDPDFDTDGDGVCDALDVCPGSPDDEDFDEDGIPDDCDICPETANVPSLLCDDGDECTINDQLDEACNCVGEYADEDSDGVCDVLDMCPGFPDGFDYDFDGLPDGCDPPHYELDCPIDLRFTHGQSEGIILEFDMPDASDGELPNPISVTMRIEDKLHFFENIPLEGYRVVVVDNPADPEGAPLSVTVEAFYEVLGLDAGLEVPEITPESFDAWIAYSAYQGCELVIETEVVDGSNGCEGIIPPKIVVNPASVPSPTGPATGNGQSYITGQITFADEIKFCVNGKPSNDFTYDPATGIFQSLFIVDENRPYDIQILTVNVCHQTLESFSYPTGEPDPVHSDHPCFPDPNYPNQNGGNNTGSTTIHTYTYQDVDVIGAMPCPNYLGVAPNGSLYFAYPNDIKLSTLKSSFNFDIAPFATNNSGTQQITGWSPYSNLILLGTSLNETSAAGTFPDGSVTFTNGTTCTYNGGNIVNLPGCAHYLGKPCDDNNPHTDLDAYNANCQCEGTLGQDADGDGVHDSEDICPNGPDDVDLDGNDVPDACECPVVVIDSTNIEDSNDILIYLTESPYYKSFIASYIDTTGQQIDTVLSSTTPVTIPNVLTGLVYDISVQGVCHLGGFPSDTVQTQVEVPFDPDAFYCGLGPDLSLVNQSPIPFLAEEDEFYAGDFKIVVSNVSGSGGYYTGTGYIEIPYLDMVRVNVKFTNIFINDDSRLVSGKVVVTGAGVAIISEEMAAILDEVIDAIDTIDDLLEQAEEVIAQIEVLIEQLGDYLPPAIITQLEEAAAAIESAQASGDAGELANAQLLLEEANDDYKAALAVLLQRIFDIIDASLEELNTEYLPTNNSLTTLQTDFENSKLAYEQFILQSSDIYTQSIIDDYNTDGDGDDQVEGVIDINNLLETDAGFQNEEVDLTTDIQAMRAAHPEFDQYVIVTDAYQNAQFDYNIAKGIDYYNQVIESQGEIELLQGTMEHSGVDLIDIIGTNVQAGLTDEQIVVIVKENIIEGLTFLIERQ